MKIVFIGSGFFGIDSLRAIQKGPHDLQLIVTQPPHPAGRGRKIRHTAVAQWAQDSCVPYIETKCVNSPPVLERIASHEPDLIVVIAFGQFLGRKLTEMPPKGTINVHGSLVPKYRGAAPINWAIINGERKTGVSIITVAPKVDAGDILASKETEILPGETADKLHDRLAALAAPVLAETIDKIANGTATYTEQDHSRATAAPKLHKASGYIHFDQPAEAIERRIRGLWSWPCVCAMYESKETGKSLRVAIGQAEVVEKPTGGLMPGTFDEDLDVVCANSVLRIKQIQPAGSRMMKFKAFINGHKIAPGDMLRPITRP